MRKVALKRRDDGADRIILLVADTRHNRRVLRLAAPDLRGEFPVSGPAAIASLARGEPQTASAVLLF
jgi:hypothetical protein